MKASTSMKLAAFCILAALTFPCFAEEPAHITVFRETSGNPLLGGLKTAALMDRDYVPSRFQFQLYLDGAHVVGLHGGRFVTFDVAPGKHEIRTNHSERLALELKPGERVFLRPGVHPAVITFSFSEYLIQVKSCEDLAAILGDKKLAPIKSKDIRFGEVAPEAAFPICADAK